MVCGGELWYVVVSLQEIVLVIVALCLVLCGLCLVLCGLSQCSVVCVSGALWSVSVLCGLCVWCSVV